MVRIIETASCVTKWHFAVWGLKCPLVDSIKQALNDEYRHMIPSGKITTTSSQLVQLEAPSWIALVVLPLTHLEGWLTNASHYRVSCTGITLHFKTATFIWACVEGLSTGSCAQSWTSIWGLGGLLSKSWQTQTENYNRLPIQSRPTRVMSGGDWTRFICRLIIEDFGAATADTGWLMQVASSKTCTKTTGGK